MVWLFLSFDFGTCKFFEQQTGITSIKQLSMGWLALSVLLQSVKDSFQYTLGLTHREISHVVVLRCNLHQPAILQRRIITKNNILKNPEHDSLVHLQRTCWKSSCFFSALWSLVTIIIAGILQCIIYFTTITHQSALMSVQVRMQFFVVKTNSLYSTHSGLWSKQVDGCNCTT